MSEGIRNFDDRVSAHGIGDAQGERLSAVAYRSAELQMGLDVIEGGTADRTLHRLAHCAESAIALFLLDKEAFHVPETDETEQVFIATGIDPHTATTEEIDSKIQEIKDRLIKHVELFRKQGEDNE